MAALAMLEVATGFMYHTIIRAASDQLADFFGLDGATISGLASRALIQGKNILAGMEVAISLIFFTGFYYCRRLIARSHYIKKLEKAAERETATLFREKEFEYEAAE